MVRIRVLGGSNTSGERVAKAWPEYLLEPFHGRCLLQNAAASGNTLLSISRNLPFPTGKSLADILILACPVEDARGTGTPPEIWGSLLKQTAWHLSRLAPLVLILPPTPIVAAKGQPRGYGRPARRWIERVHGVYQEMSELTWIKGEWAVSPTHLLDGVHLSLQGHQEAANQLIPVVKGLIGDILKR